MLLASWRIFVVFSEYGSQQADDKVALSHADGNGDWVLTIFSALSLKLNMSTSTHPQHDLNLDDVDDVDSFEDIGDNVVEVPVEAISTTSKHGSSMPRGSGGRSDGRSSGRSGVATSRASVRSWVWDHFKKEEINGEIKAVCNYCNAKLVGHYTHGTKHLIRHNKSCKRRIQIASGQQRLSFGKREGDAREVVNVLTFDKQACKEKVAKLVVMHELPLSFVEYEAFRELMYYAQPLFPPMSRNTLKNEILNMYEIEKKKTMELIETCRGRISITSDMWTASNQKKGYMVITAHFIDRNYVLHSRILRFIYVPCPHTAENLAKDLVECLVEWKVSRKVSTITLDNCSTNDAMIPYLKRGLKAEYMILKGKLFHMRCSAHILNLIVKQGLEVLGEGIESIRESVAFWSSTPKRAEKFESVAIELKLTCTKKLMLDCRTRWNSTFLMLCTALEYEEVFERLSILERDYTCYPKDEQWKLAKEMCAHLKVFYNVTELFSGTKYPTSNLFFPMICDLRLELSRWLSSYNVTISTMAGEMIKKFDKYWDILHGFLAIAAILDPTHKMDVIQFFYQKIYGDDAMTYISKVRSLLDELFNEYKMNATIYGGCLPNEAHQVVGEGSRTVGNKAKRGVYVSHAEYYSFKSQSTHKKNKSEIDLYLDDETLPESEDFDVLMWWKTNGVKYPVLAALARDILAIPVATVASESAFSTGGRHLSPYRSRLHPNTLEALMCTQNWLWASSRGLIPESELVTAEEIAYDGEDLEPSTGNLNTGTLKNIIENLTC